MGLVQVVLCAAAGSFVALAAGGACARVPVGAPRAPDAPTALAPAVATPSAVSGVASPSATPLLRVVPAPGSAPTAVREITPPLPVPGVILPAAREVPRGSLERREIALTFDCGGHAGPTREILEILREANVSVTFFMIGDWVRAYPELAREIAARHEIAHHSNTHPDYPSLTDEQIIADLEAGERTFVEVTGKSTKPLWRAPSGARDARVLAAAARAGWPVHVFWTQERDARGEPVSGDSGDWRELSPQEVASNLERAADLGNGVITVSHCDSEQTRVVLGPAIRAIQARGLRIVTVSELLR